MLHELDHADGDQPEYMGYRSKRFLRWVAFLICSIISLGSAIDAAKYAEFKANENKQNQKWVISCAGISVGLALIAVCVQLNGRFWIIFNNTKVEGFLLLILVAFWAAEVAVATDYRHGLAVSYNGAVVNGNLYYFSWAGFIALLSLLVSFLRSSWQVDLVGEINNRAIRLNCWTAFLVCTFVVMGSSANTWDHLCSNDEAGAKFCRLTMFGIILGVTGTVIALTIIGLKIVGKSLFHAEVGLAVALLITYAFGVAHITSERGPGAPLGNLYYFTWGSLISCFAVCASLYEEYSSSKEDMPLPGDREIFGGPSPQYPPHQQQPQQEQFGNPSAAAPPSRQQYQQPRQRGRREPNDNQSWEDGDVHDML
mmetsp:Transcript_19172/g.28092  ORF Transcript_19172/g.28092 Transcript_19172/m.28092 type:complete len:368 (-) Transcript_19172:138-1241(-)|eukprot:CAMPEP_0195518580 /NCGR_PEP_ID=MMETSP0794_2-20130614/13221_1 /TAXON_ID=515487 /ORGANISM="Stephanopyxis turris, Strain CCMP 815" /LENGTH=367 /DNA_ID=CAMNT_0040647581 /DNA_START=91 /DNA_END=1194 /DNA_ORIENTATION=+